MKLSMSVRIAAVFSLLSLAVSGYADTSGPRIVNGDLTQDYPTTAQYLVGNNPDNAQSWCSATVVGCNLVLTAAHCVCDTVGSQCQNLAPEGFVYLQHGGIYEVTAVAVHPTYNFPDRDVALLWVSPQITGIESTPINDQAPISHGTIGEIAGFGRTGGSSVDYGIKRWGTVETGACSGGIDNSTHVCWQFSNPVGPPTQDSNTCNGDSGGPLFVDIGGVQTIAGVTSGGSGSNCLATDNSYDASVYAFRDWIASEAGADLGTSACGGLPVVGSPSVTFEGFSGRLENSNLSDLHSVNVPAAAQRLRVTMNGEDNGLADFDLEIVGPGGESCSKDGSGQFADCEFISPSPGEWDLDVTRSSGRGDYQLTATIFNDEDAGVDFQLAVGKLDETITPGSQLRFLLDSFNNSASALQVRYTVSSIAPSGAVMSRGLRPRARLNYAAGQTRILRSLWPVGLDAEVGLHTLEIVAESPPGTEIGRASASYEVLSSP